MWQYIFMNSGERRLAWSVKHPNGTTYSRNTFAEAVDLATDLSARMKEHDVKHYRCRVYKTYCWTA